MEKFPLSPNDYPRLSSSAVPAPTSSATSKKRATPCATSSSRSPARPWPTPVVDAADIQAGVRRQLRRRPLHAPTSRRRAACSKPTTPYAASPPCTSRPPAPRAVSPCPHRRAMDRRRAARLRPRRRRGTTKNHVTLRRVGCARRGRRLLPARNPSTASSCSRNSSAASPNSTCSVTPR